jgi:Tol biopolymer transport system component
MSASTTAYEPIGRRLRRRLVYVLAGAIAGFLALSAAGVTAADATPLGKPGRIVFAAGGDIYTIDQNGSGLKHLSFAGDDREPAISSDGKLVAFASTNKGSYDIWVVDSAFTTAPVRVTTGSGQERAPAFQPLTHKIAYVANAKPGMPGDLWQVNADAPASPPQQLTATPADERDPAWSQSGQQLVYARGTAPGQQGDLWKLDGGMASPLTSGLADDKQPTWFLGKIAFARSGAPGTQADIWLMKASGGGLVQLTNGSGDESDPVGSSDGKKIAYIGPYMGTPHLLVGLVDGTWELPVPNVPANPAGPDWEGVFALNLGGGSTGSQPPAGVTVTSHGTSIELTFDLPEPHTVVDIVATDADNVVHNGLNSSASPKTHWTKAIIAGLTPGTKYTLQIKAGSYSSKKFIATTLKRNVTVTFDKVTINNDSDPNGCGEIGFEWHLGAPALNDGPFAFDTHYATLCDGETFDITDVKLQLKDVREPSVQISVLGVDDDTVWPAASAEGYGVDKDDGEWAETTLSLDVGPKTSESWVQQSTIWAGYSVVDAHHHHDGDVSFTWDVVYAVSYS